MTATARRSPCDRHPEEHSSTCYCGRPATVHVAFGSGCGNVCALHAASIAELKPGTRMTLLEPSS